LAPTGTSIYSISPSGGQTVVAGNGGYGQPAGDGGPAAKAQLNAPSAVSVDAAGNVLIADNLGRSIRLVTSDGIIRTLASIPAAAPPPAGDGGRATLASLQLATPGLSNQSGLALDAAGNLYMAETGANRVRKVSPDGTITTVAGVGGPRCSGPTVCLPLGDGGPAVKAALYFPTSVAVDDAGNLFIADYANLRVRKVSPDGIITTYAGNGGWPGWPGVGGDGGPAVAIPIVPQNLAVDRAGNLLIAEGTYGSIRKVSPDGIIRTVFDPGKSTVFFDLITAMAVDATGNLFVGGSSCDDVSCYQRIRRISPSGEATTIAGGPNALSLQPDAGIGDGGPATDARIGFISSIAVDAAGNVFLTDLLGQRVRKIDVNGIINTVGGNGLSGYSGDGGPGADASIYYPLGLATDARGNVYVSDFNQSVRVLRRSGQ
jgi:sugar lactone lactonase YvrE